MLSIEEKYLRLTVYTFYPLLLYVLRFTLFTGAPWDAVSSFSHDALRAGYIIIVFGYYSIDVNVPVSIRIFNVTKSIIIIIIIIIECIYKAQEMPRSAALVDLQSPRRPPIATCYCWRSLVCYCRPATLEQSTCRRPVCPVTRNISSQTENSSISAIISRHCSLTASP